MRIYGSGSCGKILVARVVRQLSVELVGQCVEDALARLRGPFSQTAFNNARAAFQADARTKGIDPEFVYAKKKAISFKYRGWSFKSYATSLATITI